MYGSPVYPAAVTIKLEMAQYPGIAPFPFKTFLFFRLFKNRLI
jgi:hypothetical protein